MSISLRVPLLLATLLVGTATAVARDGAMDDGRELPCSSLCRKWMEFGAERAPDTPVEAAPRPVPVSPTAASRPRREAAKIKAPTRVRGRAAARVPLPLPRPVAPPAPALARSDQAAAPPPVEAAMATAPLPSPEPVESATPHLALPERSPRQVQPTPDSSVAPGPPLAPAARDARVEPTPAPPVGIADGPRSASLSVRLGTWAALALIALMFFGRGAGAPKADGAAVHPPRSRPPIKTPEVAALSAA